jgi:hypothetical protein
LETVRNTIRQGQSRDNKTLQALEYYEAGKEAYANKDSLTAYGHPVDVGGLNAALQNKIGSLSGISTDKLTAAQSAELNQAKADLTDLEKSGENSAYFKQQQNAVRDQLVNIHVSLGSSSYKQEVATDQMTYAGGSLSSDGTITLTAKSNDQNKGNINAIGEQIIGKDVSLHADNSIFLQGAENKQTETTDYSSKGWSVGASFGPAQGGLLSVDASASKSKDKGTDILTTHTPTQVIGINSVTISTGKDLNMVGAQVSGDTVTADVGGNLHIESQQDTHTYHSKGSSSGFGITAPIGTGAISGSASSSKNNMDSDYASVTDQSGIFAGTGGFQINVESNTHLKGAVIDSMADADKNSLTTGTLTMEDIQNKAEYSTGNKGASLHIYGSKTDELAHFNETGLTPDLKLNIKDDASSTTHAAIAPGTITTTKEQADIAAINRNTTHSLNTLGEIFDRKTVEERQELTQLFSKNSNEIIHKLSEHYGWKDGGPEKTALHAIFGGISSELAGGSFSSGAWSAGANERLIQQIVKLSKGDPAKAQWLSALAGAAINSVLGKDATTGAAVAQHGTKWNLELDDHAISKRQQAYEEMMTEFNKEYNEQLDRGNSYTQEEVNEALNNLQWDASVSDQWGFSPAGGDLLNLFLDQDFTGHGISNVDYTNNGYKVVEFGSDSVVNAELKNNKMMNTYLVRQAFENRGDADVAIPTDVSSNSLYEFGIDSALGLGNATSIVSFRKIDPFTIEAKITIIDNWDHDANEAQGGTIFKDAYIVQQSGVRDTFAFKTTYDVVYTLADLYGNK